MPSERVWVVIPYAGEPGARLLRSQASAQNARVEHVHVSTDDDRQGLPRTINKGARVAIDNGATHVCWLSTGDVLLRERFSHPLPTDKGQCCKVLIESRREEIPDLDTDWQQLIYRDNQHCGSGMVVPVHIWDAVGGFDESLTYCSDWDFALKVQHDFGWECVPEWLATANEYDDGLTKSADPRKRQADRAKVAKRAYHLRKHGVKWWG